MNQIRFLKGGSKKGQADAEDAAGGAQAHPLEPGTDFTDHYEVLELSFGIKYCSRFILLIGFIIFCQVSICCIQL